MPLTDNEKRDVVKLIEDGKPLPERYRFLLFADKREVELVWNGKGGEVCNVVLPFQVIEQVDEPRAEGAGDAAAQDDLFATDARGRQLKGWSNKLIPRQWPVAPRDRGAGRVEIDLHRPAV